MSDKILRVIGYSAMTLIVLIAGVIALRWAIDFVSWSKLDSGWAQFVGSIIAMGVAFKIGAKQGKDAIAAVVLGFNLTARQKRQAYSNIAEAAKHYCESCVKAYAGEKVNYIKMLVHANDKKRESLIQSLQAIPMHELDTYEAIEHLTALKISMNYLDQAVGRINSHVQVFGASPPIEFSFDTGWILLSCENAISNADGMILELRRPLAEIAAT